MEKLLNMHPHKPHATRPFTLHLHLHLAQQPCTPQAQEPRASIMHIQRDHRQNLSAYTPQLGMGLNASGIECEAQVG